CAVSMRARASPRAFGTMSPAYACASLISRFFSSNAPETARKASTTSIERCRGKHGLERGLGRRAHGGFPVGQAKQEVFRLFQSEMYGCGELGHVLIA